jgi:transcription antitermination protein NusB
MKSKSARRRARECALQGLYQWQLSGAPVDDIVTQLSAVKGFEHVDSPYFQTLLCEITKVRAELEALLAPCLDRAGAELSPIERAILLIGAYEFNARPEIPYRVVINEAVELAKTFGGTDGHKYVNGVLDKLAASLRPNEARRVAPVEH